LTPGVLAAKHVCIRILIFVTDFAPWCSCLCVSNRPLWISWVQRKLTMRRIFPPCLPKFDHNPLPHFTLRSFWCPVGGCCKREEHRVLACILSKFKEYEFLVSLVYYAPCLARPRLKTNATTSDHIDYITIQPKFPSTVRKAQRQYIVIGVQHCVLVARTEGPDNALEQQSVSL